MNSKQNEVSSSDESSEQSSSSDDSSSDESNVDNNPGLNKETKLNQAPSNFNDNLEGIPNVEDYTMDDINKFVQDGCSSSPQMVLFKLPSDLSPKDLHGLSIKAEDDKVKTIEIGSTGRMYSYCRESVSSSKFFATSKKDQHASSIGNVSFVKPSYVISFKKLLTPAKTPKQRHFISKKSVPAMPKDYKQRLVPFGCSDNSAILSDPTSCVIEGKSDIKNWVTSISDHQNTLQDTTTKKKGKKKRKHESNPDITTLDQLKDEVDTLSKVKKKKKRKSNISAEDFSNGDLTNDNTVKDIPSIDATKKKKKSKKLKAVS